MTQEYVEAEKFNTIRDCFPLIRGRKVEIRDDQLDVINRIQNAFDNGKKFIILEAATGFGKSPVAVAIANYFKSSYIITANIALQNQYKSDFPFLRVVTGKPNHICNVFEQQNSVGKYECKNDRCKGYGKCSGFSNCDSIYASNGNCNLTSRSGIYDCILKTKLNDYNVIDYDFLKRSNGETYNIDVTFNEDKLEFIDIISGEKTWEEIKNIEKRISGNPKVHSKEIKNQIIKKVKDKIDLLEREISILKGQNYDENGNPKVMDVEDSYEIKRLEQIMFKYISYLEWEHKDLGFEKNKPFGFEYEPCLYYDQKCVGLLSPHTIMNYALFVRFALIGLDLVNVNMPGIQKKRLKIIKRYLPNKRVLILDEGHKFEEAIASFVGIELSENMLRKIVGDDEILDEILLKMNEHSKEYDKIKNSGRKNIEQRTIELKQYNEKFYVELCKLLPKMKTNYDAVRIEIEQMKDFINNKKPNPEEERKMIEDLVDVLDRNPKLRNNSKIIKFLQSDVPFSNKIYNIEKMELSYLMNLSEKIKEHTDKMEQIINCVSENITKWAFYIYYNEKKIEIKPVDVSEYAKIIYGLFDKVVIMSATILSDQMFRKQIGIDLTDDNVEFISEDSKFPSNNKPIYLQYAGVLSYKNKTPYTLKKFADKIIEIMNMNRNNKGIIHLSSYELINELKPYLTNKEISRFIEFQHNGKSVSSSERQKKLNYFFNTREPKVLVSPSLYEGIDLRGDLSRFQIIIKIPYPDMKDNWVLGKMCNDDRWYSWTTLLKIVQGYGRSIRDEDDTADTYILDRCFENIRQRCSNMIPESFNESIIN